MLRYLRRISVLSGATSALLLSLFTPRAFAVTRAPSEVWAISGSQFSAQSGNNSENPVPIELDDIGNSEKRSILQFSLAGLQIGLPTSQVLVGVSLVVTPTSRVGDSIFQYHGYANDDFVSLNEAYGDDRLMGRLEDYSLNVPQATELDPGFLSQILDQSSHLGIVVRQETDLATGGFNGRFTASAPELELTFINEFDSGSNIWLGGGFGGWNATSSWTKGIPISSEDVFIQPPSTDLILGPPSFKAVNSLVLGGGGGQATLRIDADEQFQAHGQTTLFSDAVLDLNGGTYRTGGLNNVTGGTIDWGDDGVLAIESGYLSVPPGDFIVDGPAKPLLLMVGGKLIQQNEPSLQEDIIVGDAQGGFLLVGSGSEVRTFGLKLGNQVSGDGQLQVDGADAFLEVKFLLEVGATGRGSAIIENGARLEGPAVTVGSSITGVYDPTTFASMTFQDVGTTAKLRSLFANGRSLVEIKDGAVVDTEAAGGTGDATNPPILRVTGFGSRLNITGRLETGSLSSGNGSSQIFVENGGRIDTHQIILSFGLSTTGISDSQLTITGAGSEINVSDVIFLSAFGDAQSTFDVLNGGVLRAASLTALSTAEDTIATVRISGTDSRWEQTGELFIGGGRTNDTLELVDAGEATFTVQSGATLEAAAAVNVMLRGTFNLEGGTVTAPLVQHDRGGAFNFTGGTLSVDQFVGDLTNDGGTVAPGQSAGITEVTGLFGQNLGVLEIEIYGGGSDPIAGVDFDQLLADTAEIEGGLSLILDASYVPALGDEFAILQTTNGLSGVFETTSSGLPDLGVDLGWNINYTTHSVLLEVISALAISGDFDGDGDVDGADFLSWQREDGTGDGLIDWENGYNASAASGDFDNDGDVDGADFLSWQRDNATSADLILWENSFGTSSLQGAGSLAVPEPTALTLALGTAFTCLGMRCSLS